MNQDALRALRAIELILASLAGASFVSGVAAQPASPVPTGIEKRLTLWDLPLGSHARELPRLGYSEFACGTNGGPPSIQVPGWTGFARCPAEKDSGLHEIYFRYDDELEYRAKAQDPMSQAPYRPEGTAEFQIPVIVSGLFDAAGFLVGVRMVTDPRTNEEIREHGTELGGALRSRIGMASWSCQDLPPAVGETPYRATFTKERCERRDADNGTFRRIALNYYRKPGQTTLDPVTRLITTGQFVSETRYEAVLVDGIADGARRLAAIRDPAPTALELLAQRARNCPACDLRGADLKRADLRNANLAGADLTGAILHGAILAGADLTNAKLDDANLNRADLRQAKLSGAKLTETMMYETRLDGANLTNADISGSLAAKVNMTNSVARGLIAFGADLRLARMLDSDLTGADLSESLFEDAQLARANLQGAKLVLAVLWNTSLTEANLSRVDARGIDLTGANLRDANLSAADFSNAVLDNTILSGVVATGTKFDGATPPPTALR